MGGVPVPDLFAEEEVIIGDFSFEGILGNTKIGISVGEIVMIPGILVLQ